MGLFSEAWNELEQSFVRLGYFLRTGQLHPDCLEPWERQPITPLSVLEDRKAWVSVFEAARATLSEPVEDPIAEEWPDEYTEFTNPEQPWIIWMPDARLEKVEEIVRDMQSLAMHSAFISKDPYEITEALREALGLPEIDEEGREIHEEFNPDDWTEKGFIDKTLKVDLDGPVVTDEEFRADCEKYFEEVFGLAEEVEPMKISNLISQLVTEWWEHGDVKVAVDDGYDPHPPELDYSDGKLFLW